MFIVSCNPEDIGYNDLMCVFVLKGGKFLNRRGRDVVFVVVPFMNRMCILLIPVICIPIWKIVISLIEKPKLWSLLLIQFEVKSTNIIQLDVPISTHSTSGLGGLAKICTVIAVGFGDEEQVGASTPTLDTDSPEAKQIRSWSFIAKSHQGITHGCLWIWHFSWWLHDFI